MRKGIILAGGKGKRLHPITKVISKQLIPVYDKPLIFYPLSILINLGIKDILIICVPEDVKILKKLLIPLKLSVNIKFAIQKKPNGLPEAFKIGKNFISKFANVLILGDNIFYNKNLLKIISNAFNDKENATIFVKKVLNPKEFGVISFDKDKKINIKEKPKNPKSKLAITGLYFFPSDVHKKAKLLKPSIRGETEITDLIKIYAKENRLNIVNLNKTIWLDTGTPERLLFASNKIRNFKIKKRIIIGNLD